MNIEPQRPSWKAPLALLFLFAPPIWVYSSTGSAILLGLSFYPLNTAIVAFNVYRSRELLRDWGLSTATKFVLLGLITIFRYAVFYAAPFFILYYGTGSVLLAFVGTVVWFLATTYIESGIWGSSA